MPLKLVVHHGTVVVVNSGKKLENLTFDLLQLSGAKNLKPEVMVGTKKCDLYYETHDAGFVYRTAVECKDYEKPLNRSDISSIFAEYQDMVGNEIDRLIIVTRNGLEAKSLTRVNNSKFARHTTIRELQLSVCNFRQYVYLKNNQLSEEGRDQIYVPCVGKMKSGEHIKDMHNFLLSKINNSNAPIALIGDYGVGKTTSLKSLFSSLAKAFLEDETNPVPIFVELSRMTTEQSMEGLFGTIFTAEFPTAGYSYPLFEHLNASGRVILLLDGFDEMRQKLEWTAFKNILDNIGLLAHKNDKVVFSGRPTAFLNRDEYEYAINGKSTNKLQIIEGKKNTNYSEIFISGFGSDEVKGYISKVSKSDQFPDFSHHDESRLLEIYASNKSIQDLASRPVQLFMICHILPSLERNAQINAAMIYDLFVDFLIDRDIKKRSRESFSKMERRKFATEVSWFLWSKGESNRTSSSDLPEQLFSSFWRTSSSLAAIKRDLIVGSFMSSEKGEQLHFPHRSIQEYLVAEKAIDLITEAPDKVVQFLKTYECTSTIKRFIKEMINAFMENSSKKIERNRKVSQQSRSDIFGTRPPPQKFQKIFELLIKQEGVVDCNVIDTVAYSPLLISGLFNLGRRSKNCAVHIVFTLHWLHRSNDLGRELRIQTVKAIIEELNNKTFPNEWKLFVILMLASILENEQIIKDFFENTAIQRMPITKNSNFEIDIASCYKRVQPFAKKIAVPEAWLRGTSFSLENVKLLTRISDWKNEFQIIEKPQHREFNPLPTDSNTISSYVGWY